MKFSWPPEPPPQNRYAVDVLMVVVEFIGAEESIAAEPPEPAENDPYVVPPPPADCRLTAMTLLPKRVGTVNDEVAPVV